MNLNISHYHNCYDVIVDSFLKRENIDSYKFWAISGLSFNKKYKEINTKFISLKNQMIKFGLEKIDTKCYERDFFSTLDVQLSSRPVAILIDLYELPYCSLYQKEHELHSLEIVGKSNDDYCILDHFFAYKGILKKNQLNKAVKSTIQNLSETIDIFYFNRKYKIEPNVLDIVCLNYQYLNEFSINKNSDEIFGINSINHIKEYIQELPFDIDLYEKLYYQIKEVSNSRYHFGEFLKKYNFKKAGDAYIECHQKWLNIANLTLRSIITENTEKYIIEVEEIITQLIKKESKALSMLKEVYIYEYF